MDLFKSFRIKNECFTINEIKPDGEIRWINKYEYEFDDNGNWVKQTYSLNKKPKHVYERKLEYYP